MLGSGSQLVLLQEPNLTVKQHPQKKRPVQSCPKHCSVPLLTEQHYWYVAQIKTKPKI